MKALTICQPYPYLIFLPESDPRHKRVENRRWATSYRGPLLIHAGRSREWLDLDEEESCDETFEIPLREMVFGAIVGVVDVVDCFSMEETSTKGAFRGLRVPDESLRRHPWLANHGHCEGPFCHVYANCRRFAKPIPYRGAQGFFDVPDELVSEALSALV